MAAFTAVDPAVRGPLDGQPNSIALVASGVYTATASAEFGVPADAQVVELVFDQTAGTAGQSVTFQLEGWNPATNAFEVLIVSAARTQATTDNAAVLVNPYTASVANVSAQRAVRRRMRATVTHADTKNVTYSLSVHVS